MKKILAVIILYVMATSMITFPLYLEHGSILPAFAIANVVLLILFVLVMIMMIFSWCYDIIVDSPDTSGKT